MAIALRQHRIIPLISSGGFFYTTLLDGETAGLAIDFTDTNWFDRQTWDQEWNQVRTTPGNDAWSSPHTFYTNSGTSPKVVKTSSTGLGWSPHNMGLRSQELNNAAWGGDSGTVTANQIAAPDNAVTADKFTQSGAASNQNRYWNAGVTTVASTNYTASIYVKTSSWQYVTLIINTAATGWVAANYDLLAGTVTSHEVGVGSAATWVDSTIIGVGGGWYRITLSGSHNGTTTGFEIAFSNASTPTRGAFGEVSFTGDGASFIYLWGAQLNRGIAPTAYIATTTAAVIGLPISYGEGLLVEPAATNLLFRSQELENAYWDPFELTVSANSTSAPDGSSTSDRLTDTAVNDSHDLSQFTPDLTVVSGTVYTLSVYAKYVNIQFLQLAMNTTGFTGLGIRNFDIQNGSLGGTAGTLVDSTITPIGNGWYRCTISMTCTGNASTASPDISLQISSSATRVGSYAGTGSGAMDLWGFQFESGTVATSYIPTTSASVTRATDAPNVATSDYPHSNSAGTFIAWIVKKIANATNADHILNLNNGTANEVFSLNVVTADTPDSAGVEIIDGGVQQVNPAVTKTGSIVVIGNELAAFYTANDSGVLADGGSEVADVSCTMPTVTNLQLGYSQDTASRELNGFIRRLIYVPRRMTQAQMQSKTI